MRVRDSKCRFLIWISFFPLCLTDSASTPAAAAAGACVDALSTRIPTCDSCCLPEQRVCVSRVVSRSTATGIAFTLASILIILCLLLTMSSEFSSFPECLRRASHHLENHRSTRNFLGCLFVAIIFLASFAALVS